MERAGGTASKAWREAGMQEWTWAVNLLIIALKSLRNAIETAIMAANWRMSETD